LPLFGGQHRRQLRQAIQSVLRKCRFFLHDRRAQLVDLAAVDLGRGQRFVELPVQLADFAARRFGSRALLFIEGAHLLALLFGELRALADDLPIQLPGPRHRAPLRSLRGRLLGRADDGKQQGGRHHCRSADENLHVKNTPSRPAHPPGKAA
jgi:hypothetical protein